MPCGKLEGNASKVWTISGNKQAPIHVSEFGLETLALLNGPKRAFHIALVTAHNFMNILI